MAGSFSQIYVHGVFPLKGIAILCLIGYHDTPSGFGSFMRPGFYNIAIPSGLGMSKLNEELA